MGDKYGRSDKVKVWKGSNVLHIAATCGRARVCFALLQHTRFGALDAQTVDGYTALHIAAWRGETVEADSPADDDLP